MDTLRGSNPKMSMIEPHLDRTVLWLAKVGAWTVVT